MFKETRVISAPREWGIWLVLGWHFEGSGYFGFVPIADNALTSLGISLDGL